MSGKDLIRADEAARRAALDVSRSFIVQAPAGSGKTELLIQRYLRLLAIVEHPEEVLAITFTRKAAAEMQRRVLEALRRAAAGDEPETDYERVTHEAALAVLDSDRKRDWQLPGNPRRMRIQTLDSLNASIARTQPVTSTAGAAGYAIVADADMRALYRDAAAATLDQLAESGPLAEATANVLRHVDTNTYLYIDYLERMLATRDQWLPFIGSGSLVAAESAELRARFEQSLEMVVRQALSAVGSAVPVGAANDILEHARYAAANLLSDNKPDHPIAALIDSEKLPGGRAGWLGIAELLLTRQGDLRKRADKNLGFPAGDDGQKEGFHELLESLGSASEFIDKLADVRLLPPTRYTDEQWSVLLALFRLLPLAATELKRLFTERGMTDHIEVALNASAALGTADAPGDIALLLDYQIRHILVDEMQDTSSAQYRMLEALTGGWSDGDGRTLYCVGDPMQSIYRFRNAEVGQFLLAQEAGIGDLRLETLTLRRNFRSGAHLVEWFNEVFPTVLAARNDPQLSAVAYAEAAAVPEQEGAGDVVVHPVIGSNTRAEADTALRIVEETLDAFADDDMAILVRGRTHLPALLYRLREAGIPYQAVEIDRLTDLPEVIDVLALTRALTHLGDRHAWLALLRSPCVGLDWADLHAIVRNDTRSTVWERICDQDVLAALSQQGRDAVTAFRQRMSAVVDSYRIESLRDKVERLWLESGGPALVDGPHAVENVYRFLDVIERNELAGDLPDVAVLEGILDTEHVSSNVDARLQIMTMHRAKGLQFDHVLLHGLGRVPRARDPHVMSWFDIPDEHGRPRKVISPVGPRALLERDPVHAYIERIEARKDRNELGRLLYVACTRARKSLHLLGSAYARKTGVRPDARSLLHLLWPAVADRYEAVLDPQHVDAQTGDDERWLSPVLRRFGEPWATPRAPELPARAELPESAEATPVEFYWVGAGARFAGTVVHRWIQLATDGQVDLGNLDAGTMRRSSRRWLREMGIAGEASEPIIERVAEALDGIAQDNKGRWLLEGPGHAELPLTGAFGPGVASVVIDRVRIDEDGTHWIVDYKTSSHEGGDLGAFLDAEADRYRPQLTKYATLYRHYVGVDVRCALYFPLLQQFVEVEL